MLTTLIALIIPTLIIVGMALALAMGAVVEYRLAARTSPQQRLVVVVLAVAIGALLSVALTSRTLDETNAESMMVFYSDLAGGFAASRWVSLFLVVTSLVEIARGVIGDRRRAQPDPARSILVSMLAYFLGTMLIQAFASDHPDFEPRNFYVPIVLGAVYYQRPPTLTPVMDASRLAVLTLMVCSLAGIWLRPDFVMHRPDKGWIPGVDWRLYGFAPHANALGPVALLGILIELLSPARSRMLHWLALGSAAAVVILAQPKTTWAAVPLMLLFVWLPLNLRRATPGEDGARNFRRTVWTLSGVILLLVLMAVASVVFDVWDAVETRSDLMTLTGRTQIWDITLRAWHENVLFGYGAGIWGPERQMQFNMFHVGHAHNQVVQTLGEAGLAGLALLLFYLGTLLVASLRGFMASRGMVLMLLILMLVLCVTEAPMRGEGLLSWQTFLQVLLVMTACWHVRATHATAQVRDSLRAGAREPGGEPQSTSSGFALRGS